jgi:hypothetical protein
MTDRSMIRREQFAAFTRRVIDGHTEWDGLHAFMTLHERDGDIAVGTYAALDPAIDPNRYPAMIANLAAEQYEKDPGLLTVGYCLQIEAHGVTGPGPGATAAERETFERARITRTFHQLPTAVESAVAYTADIHGRLWTAGKIRGRDGVSEHYYPAGDRHISGQMVRALIAAALATRAVQHGLPLPQAAN